MRQRVRRSARYGRAVCVCVCAHLAAQIDLGHFIATIWETYPPATSGLARVTERALGELFLHFSSVGEAEAALSVVSAAFEVTTA